MWEDLYCKRMPEYLEVDVNKILMEVLPPERKASYSTKVFPLSVEEAKIVRGWLSRMLAEYTSPIFSLHDTAITWLLLPRRSYLLFSDFDTELLRCFPSTNPNNEENSEIVRRMIERLENLRKKYLERMNVLLWEDVRTVLKKAGVSLPPNPKDGLEMDKIALCALLRSNADIVIEKKQGIVDVVYFAIPGEGGLAVVERVYPINLEKPFRIIRSNGLDNDMIKRIVFKKLKKQDKIVGRIERHILRELFRRLIRDRGDTAITILDVDKEGVVGRIDSPVKRGTIRLDSTTMELIIEEELISNPS